MSLIVDVAEAVKDELNAATTFTVPFQAERSYADWAAVLEEDKLRVDVVPWNWIPSMDSRGSDNYQCEVDVLIRQRMGMSAQAGTGITQLAELDALMEHCEVVYEYFVPSQTTQDGRRLASVPNAVDVTWEFASIPADGGVASGWFWGTLSCTAGQVVNNDSYRVVSSDEGVASPDGDPLSFTSVAPTLNPSFSQSATVVEPNTTVTFNSTSTSNGALTTLWTWDFGDGNTGTGSTTSHVYTTPGAFTVTLTITDACEFSDSVSVANAITVNEYLIYLPVVVRNH